MKKTLIVITLCLLSIVNFAQVDGSITSQDVQTEYTPVDPFGIARIEFNTNIDTVKVYYWVYKYIGNIQLWKSRKSDCYIPYSNQDKVITIYQRFNAWIRNKYNIQ